MARKKTNEQSGPEGVQESEADPRSVPGVNPDTDPITARPDEFNEDTNDAGDIDVDPDPDEDDDEDDDLTWDPAGPGSDVQADASQGSAAAPPDASDQLVPKVIGYEVLGPISGGFKAGDAVALDVFSEAEIAHLTERGGIRPVYDPS